MIEPHTIPPLSEDYSTPAIQSHTQREITTLSLTFNSAKSEGTRAYISRQLHSVEHHSTASKLQPSTGSNRDHGLTAHRQPTRYTARNLRGYLHGGPLGLRNETGLRRTTDLHYDRRIRTLTITQLQYTQRVI